jgi:UPF0755 protein
MKEISILRSIFSINLLEIFVVVLSTAFSFYATSTLTPKGVIEITPNTTAKKIIADLSKQGYEVNRIDSIILSRLGTLQAGEVRLNQQPMTKLDFLYQLTKAKEALLKVTLIPGETSTIFFEEVAKTLDVNATKLQEAYDKHALFPEAGIAAETYLVPKKMNEERFITFLLKYSNTLYKKLATTHLGEYTTEKWLEILTIASIIQKEAANTQEMPLVSSVIYNRLKKGMKLQMDGTLNYGKYSHIKITPQRIREDESRFNTYKYEGLPPSPIGAVSTQAIDAAIYPAQTNYLFFMKNSQGEHNFTETFRAHNRNVKKARLKK